MFCRSETMLKTVGFPVGLILALPLCCPGWLKN
jgi:hypothetical protein